MPSGQFSIAQVRRAGDDSLPPGSSDNIGVRPTTVRRRRDRLCALLDATKYGSNVLSLWAGLCSYCADAWLNRIFEEEHKWDEMRVAPIWQSVIGVPTRTTRAANAGSVRAAW